MTVYYKGSNLVVTLLLLGVGLISTLAAAICHPTAQICNYAIVCL